MLCNTVHVLHCLLGRVSLIVQSCTTCTSLQRASQGLTIYKSALFLHKHFLSPTVVTQVLRLAPRLWEAPLWS